jgi:hypothetical protein
VSTRILPAYQPVFACMKQWVATLVKTPPALAAALSHVPPCTSTRMAFLLLVPHARRS